LPGVPPRRRWPEPRKVAAPHELANAALLLASDLSSYLAGSELVVDGGRTAGSPWRPA